MVAPAVTLDQVAQLCEAIKKFLAGLRGLESRGVANPGSPATNEWATFRDTAHRVDGRIAAAAEKAAAKPGVSLSDWLRELVAKAVRQRPLTKRTKP